MLSQLLTAAAIAAFPQGDIVVINDVPSIVIPLERYDLRQPGDVRSLHYRIARAAKLVCEDDGAKGIAFIDAARCSHKARAGGEAQLAGLLANSPAPALTAAITVVAPVN